MRATQPITSGLSQQKSYCGTSQRKFVWKAPKMGMQASELDLGRFHPQTLWHQGALWEEDKPQRVCGALGNVLLNNPGFKHSCRHQFDTCLECNQGFRYAPLWHYMMVVASFSTQCHTARVVQEYKEKIEMLPWSPNSPDLSLIKHLEQQT